MKARGCYLSTRGFEQIECLGVYSRKYGKLDIKAKISLNTGLASTYTQL